MRGVAVIVLSLALVACPAELTLHTTSEDTGAPGTMDTSGEPTAPTTGAAVTTSGGASTGGSTGPAAVTTSEGSSGAGTTSTDTGEAETSSGTTTGTTTAAGESTTEVFGLPFDCYGCLCDADIHYCQQVFGGVTQLPMEGCPLVDPDSLGSGCVLFPERCGGTPSCDCLPTMKGACYCKEVDPGVFEVICPNP